MARIGSPGWLPDPEHRHEYRYFDGREWTAHASDGGVQVLDELRPNAPHTPPPTRSIAAPSSSKVPGSTIIIGLGGVLMCVGAMLPWATLTALNVSRDLNGLDKGNDGWITLVLGGLALLTLLTSSRAIRAVVAVVAALGGGLAAIADIGNVMDKVDGLERTSHGIASGHVGIGLWMTAAAALVLFVGAFAAATDKS